MPVAPGPDVPWAAICLAALLAASPPARGADGGSPAQPPAAASAEATARYVDSAAWQAHFEKWVEHTLAREQVEQASAERVPFDSERVRIVLEDLEERRFAQLRDAPQLPPQAIPRPLGRGLQGAALEAARAYASGDRAGALERLRAPALASDGQALHVRAQLIDELTAGMHPIYRLAGIELYREALRAERDLPQADRARVRIAQMYLELGLVPEARAELRPLLEQGLGEPYASAALISAAEATLADRDPTRALELLARLDLDALAPETRAWELRRRADSLFALRRFTEALDLYRELLGDEPARAAERLGDDALLAARFGFALACHGRAPQAVQLLDAVLTRPLPPAGEATVRLALARALRAVRAFERATEVAAGIPPLRPAPEIAALGAAEALESARRGAAAAGASDPEEPGLRVLPEGTAELIEPTSSVPERGLLDYRVAVLPVPGDGPAAVVDRLARLLIALPPGDLRLLVQDDLVSRLGAALAAAAQGDSGPDDAELLDRVERALRPALVGENELLLALEALYRAGRRSTCVRWSRVLQQREERPIRRGQAAWRRAQCLRAGDADAGAADWLLADADGGESGAFAVALAALAAEHQLRRGELARALETYQRAAEALVDPRLAGPVLLRLGELRLEAGSDALALRELLRGLAAPLDPSDPFRKAGVLALLRLGRRGTGGEQLVALLREERGRAEPWWAEAYTYLGQRAGDVSATAPPGGGPFARAAREFAALDGLRDQIRTLARRKELADSSR
jgi:tetratricopeptide (TPR) repeat protein